MLPRLPIYLFSGASSGLAANRGGRLRCTAIEASLAHLDTLAQLDVSALGFSREKHHRYLLDDASMKGVLLHDGGNCVGYAYVSATGHVGPLAVAQAHYMDVAFETALELAAASGAGRLSAFLPGTSDAPGVALKHGMRIAFPMVLVATREFGDWRRYLPRNPGFM
jgi:hypothetical protein